MNDLTKRTWPVSARARDLHDAALVWDSHSCLPLKAGVDISDLERHRAAGIDYVSVNVGMDFNPLPQVIRVLATFRGWLAARPERYAIAGTVEDVRRAKAQGKLAVTFDLEGSDMIEGDIDMLRLYRDLGVRQMHLAYNRDNPIAGGCHGADIGLSALATRSWPRSTASASLWIARTPAIAPAWMSWRRRPSPSCSPIPASVS